MNAHTVVVLDTPLLDAAAWTQAVFDKAGFTAVENSRVNQAMAKDPEARKALMANINDLMGAAEQLAPHYRKAAFTVAGDAARLGMYGVAWVAYMEEVAACVVDWSEVEKRANAPGVTPADREGSIQLARDAVGRRTRLLPPGRLLELEGNLPAAEREAKALAFLHGLGLAA